MLLSHYALASFPMISILFLWPVGPSLNLYIFLVSTCAIARLCIAKEVASFPGASSVNFMGVAHNRTCARALQSSKPEEGKLLVALKLIASYST